MSRTTIQDTSLPLDVTKLRPIGDYVLLRLSTRSMSKGGIHIPETANKATELQIGEVIAVSGVIPNRSTGADIKLDDIRIGDFALTMDYMGERIETKDGSFRLVREHGIWATVDFENKAAYELKVLRPRFDCVLLEPKDEAMTESGLLHLPNAENRRSGVRRATVVSVGPGKWHLPTSKRLPVEVKAGDKVIFQRYAGAVVRILGKTYRLCQEQDIHLVTKGK